MRQFDRIIALNSTNLSDKTVQETAAMIKALPTNVPFTLTLARHLVSADKEINKPIKVPTRQSLIPTGLEPPLVGNVNKQTVYEIIITSTYPGQPHGIILVRNKSTYILTHHMNCIPFPRTS